jgi:hypothetical protein
MNEALESRLRTVSVERRQSGRTFLNQGTEMLTFHRVRFQVFGEFWSEIYRVGYQIKSSN